MDEKKSNDNNIVACYACKKHLDIEQRQKISRQEECVFCRANLRCCRMCGYYSKNVYNECHEPNAERILDKERVNFCSYFEIRRGADSENTEKKNQTDAASSLFKD